MIIRRLKINKLYGYIDKDIDFNEDMTLLVGINGAGKTSILNAINWIVQPSLESLCVTEFDSLQLWFTYQDLEYKVTCIHKGLTFGYTISNQERSFHPLIVPLDEEPKNIENDEGLRSNLRVGYKRLTPDEKEKETWDLIRSFPSPTIIGLDRNLYTEESSNMIYFDEGVKSSSRRKKGASSKSPLDRVKELINVEYRKRKNDVLNLTNSLKNQLMISAFDGSITLDGLSSGSGIQNNLNLSQIKRAEERVNNYFEKFEKATLSKTEQTTISNYFSELKKITSEFQKNPNKEMVKVLYALNAHQFAKIRNLLKEFEKFERKSIQVMKDIQEYLDTLNHFLKDSSKRIVFKEDTSEITFHNLNKEGVPVKKYKDISFLSSGEQQILILFSYIAFNSQDGKIFIIDEPELSLHIKWQEDFLKQLEKITPKTTQIILATHSPILAHKMKHKAISLLPYNI